MFKLEISALGFFKIASILSIEVLSFPRTNSLIIFLDVISLRLFKLLLAIPTSSLYVAEFTPNILLIFNSWLRSLNIWLITDIFPLCKSWPNKRLISLVSSLILSGKEDKLIAIV